jgi:hypothetical protein
MSRKSRAQRVRDLNREQEVLHAPVNPTGQGEDPAIKALFQRLAYADHVEAVEIALQLQKLVRGSNSMLEDPEQAESLARIRQDAAERDDAARRYAENQQKFIDETWDKAEKLLPPEGPARDKLRATGAAVTQKAMEQAAVVEAHNRKRLDWELDSGPKEMLTVQGQMTTIREGDSLRTVMEPVQIGIRHRQYKLHPGTYLVPKVVADIYRARMRGHAEQAERERAMAPREGIEGRDDHMVRRLDDISRRYGSGGEQIPAYGIR